MSQTERDLDWSCPECGELMLWIDDPNAKEPPFEGHCPECGTVEPNER